MTFSDDFSPPISSRENNTDCSTSESVKVIVPFDLLLCRPCPAQWALLHMSGGQWAQSTSQKPQRHRTTCADWRGAEEMTKKDNYNLRSPGWIDCWCHFWFLALPLPLCLQAFLRAPPRMPPAESLRRLAGCLQRSPARANDPDTWMTLTQQIPARSI